MNQEIQSCVVSRRYLKMKAIHNTQEDPEVMEHVVLYHEDT